MAPYNRKCVLCGAKGTRGFYSFPKNGIHLETWLYSTGLESVKEGDKVCSKHFKAEDFIPNRSEHQIRRCLKKTAVPFFNVPKVSIKLDRKCNFILKSM